MPAPHACSCARNCVFCNGTVGSLVELGVVSATITLSDMYQPEDAVCVCVRVLLHVVVAICRPASTAVLHAGRPEYKQAFQLVRNVLTCSLKLKHHRT